jgi:hypothetical protein
MAFAAFTSFSETPFSSLPSNIYLNISGQQVNINLGNIISRGGWKYYNSNRP